MMKGRNKDTGTKNFSSKRLNDSNETEVLSKNNRTKFRSNEGTLPNRPGNNR
jgi:hypothetical protein